MSNRYNSILDGCSVNDTAAGGGYTYYLFLRPGGSGVIMRATTDETEFRFYAFSSFSSATWTDRASHTYKRTSEYKKL